MSSSFGRPKLGRKVLAAALGAVLEQPLRSMPIDRRELAIIGEGAVLDDVGRRREGAEAAAPEARLEGERRLRTRRERRVEPVDAIAELLVVGGEVGAGDLEIQELDVLIELPHVDFA